MIRFSANPCWRAAGRAFLVTLMIITLAGVEWKHSHSIRASKTHYIPVDTILMWDSLHAVSSSSVHAHQSQPFDSSINDVMFDPMSRDVFGVCERLHTNGRKYPRLHRTHTESHLCAELQWPDKDRFVTRGVFNGVSRKEAVSNAPSSDSMTVLSAKVCQFLRYRLALSWSGSAHAFRELSSQNQPNGTTGSTSRLSRGLLHQVEGSLQVSPPVPSFQIVCGVRIDASVHSSLCGAPLVVDKGSIPVSEAESDVALSSIVKRERDVDPLSREAPRTFHLWNKALAAGCDVGPQVVLDDTAGMDVAGYTERIQAWIVEQSATEGEDGSKLGKRAVTIYVVTTQTLPFFSRILPFLRSHEQPYILVTGGSDVSAPIAGLNMDGKLHGEHLRDILQDPLLRAWFAQNLDYRHPKLVPIPIGLDFHTLADPALDDKDGKPGSRGASVRVPRAEAGRSLQARGQGGMLDWSAAPVGKRMHAWGPAQSAQEQDATLTHLRCTLPHLALRPVAALLNFKTAGRGERDRVGALLSGQPGIVSINDIQRAGLWRRYGEFSFVVSPRGYGKDCHRTWEALALGSIPIVSADAFLSALYEHLPVVVVDRWASVTLSSMEDWKREILAKWAKGEYRWELMRTEWWLWFAGWIAAGRNDEECASRLGSIWVVGDLPKIQQAYSETESDGGTPRTMDGGDGGARGERMARATFLFPS